MFSTYWGRISKESTTLQAEEHPTQQRSRINERGEQNATWNHQLKSKTARSWGCGFREESWLALMRSWVLPPALQKKKINTGDQGTLVILKSNTFHFKIKKLGSETLSFKTLRDRNASVEIHPSYIPIHFHFSWYHQKSLFIKHLRSVSYLYSDDLHITNEKWVSGFF